uniref:Uncharacterized protein n=1 Tax=Noccaea caerulescens TaxID=107243 RepID=A0A1J3JQS9_NOCCA
MHSDNKERNEIRNSKITLRSLSIPITLSHRFLLRFPVYVPPSLSLLFLLRRRRRRRDTDPSWIHLIRGLHPAPAQQNSKPEAPEGVDNARLGSKSACVLNFLPTPQRAWLPLESIEGAVDRRASRTGGGCAETDRRHGLRRDGSGATSASRGER